MIPFTFILLALCATLVYVNKCGWALTSTIVSVITTCLGEKYWHRIEDLLDTSDWKSSQRKLERGGYIRKDTIIRISFAYLYRIKIKDKYLLVKNGRGTGKYQPVGGVYKLKESEKLILKNLFQVKDDDKIPIDKSSKNDYRLRMDNRYLRRFVRRFDRKAVREKIDNVGREFKEELVDTGIVDWKQITYRFCGRHMAELKYGDHFQIYELLLADVVELLPSPEQEDDLINLMTVASESYRFVTSGEVMSLGIDAPNGSLLESIGDHTKKILEESEGELMKIAGTGKVYSVTLA